MASFNQVILLGNLTRDPQLKYLPSQTAVCEFGLACNRKFKAANGEAREEVTFVDCTAFGKQAEVLNQYCSKGKPLFIQGRLKYDSWEDKQGGGKRSKITVVIENFQLIGGRDGATGAPRSEGGEGAAPPRQPTRPAARPAPAAGPQTPPDDAFGDEQQFKDDDIPF